MCEPVILRYLICTGIIATIWIRQFLFKKKKNYGGVGTLVQDFKTVLPTLIDFY
jgi:hypothetical protein